MADPFVAEIRIVTFNFAPQGWAFCDGQFLPLSQNTALFSLLGTTYGGNGQSNFALPNLQGRMPMQPGQGPGLSLRDLGESGGAASGHAPRERNALAFPRPQSGNRVGYGGAGRRCAWALLPRGPTRPARCRPRRWRRRKSAGGGQPHNNLPPYLVLNFVIALQGVYPPRT